MERFSGLLRGYRERAGLSQNELARRAGVNPGSINRIESGEREPSSRELIVRLSDALGLSPFELDQLLLAAGQLPTMFDRIPPDDPILLLVGDILGDPSIPESERREFRLQIQLAARRWRQNVGN